MIQRFCILLTLFTFGCLSTASAQTLKIGDPAPPIQVKRFLQGRPITSFERGKSYVVTFLLNEPTSALDCLSELQRRHRKVQFLCILMSDQDDRVAQSFVRQKGKRLQYPVALDTANEKAPLYDLLMEEKVSYEGHMAQTWLKEAGLRPGTVFFVDGEGKIAWMGPLWGLYGMAQPLDVFANGGLSHEFGQESAIRFSEFIRTEGDRNRKQQSERQQELMAIHREISHLAENGPSEQLITRIDALKTTHPDVWKGEAPLKVRGLIDLGRYDEALELANDLMANNHIGRFSDTDLAVLATYLASSPERQSELLPLAVKVMGRVRPQVGSQKSYLNSQRSWLLFRQGRFGEALRLARNALRQTSPPMDAEIRRNIQIYESARSATEQLRLEPRQYLLKYDESSLRLKKAKAANDPLQVLSAIESSAPFLPESGYAVDKLRALLTLKREDEALVYGNHLKEEALKDTPRSADRLNELAWTLVEPGRAPTGPRLLVLAEEAAERSNELTSGRNVQVLDTLARVYFVQGKVRQAVDTQAKALEVNKQSQMSILGEFEARFEEYKAALKE